VAPSVLHSVVMPLVWLVFFVVGCAWFTRRPAAIVVLPVLAVVVCGLMLGHRSTDIQSAGARVTERVIWRTVQFLLESAVFLLIGLQLKELVIAARESEIANGRILSLSVVVLVTVQPSALAGWEGLILPHAGRPARR